MRLLHPRSVTLALVPLALGCGSAAPRPEPQPVAAGEAAGQQHEPVEATLQRRAAGLVVTRSDDGGIAVNPRAPTSFAGERKTPLYILNGTPFRPGPGGALTGIDPMEIESLKLVRGADAGIYGIEGANGVIVITMKKPPKPEGKP